MKPIVGILILLIVVAIFSGVGAMWEILCNLLAGILDCIKEIPGFVSALWPILGIEDAIVAWTIFGVVLMILSLMGIILSTKKQKKLWIAICGCVEVVSTLITISSVVNL